MHLQTFRKTFNPRREFNPASKKDLLELKYFKNNNKWKDVCPFYLQDPFVEIPTMCERLYTNYMLSRLK
jgi:hypothetical protein